MANKFCFFTDVDLLDTVDYTSIGQTQNNSFGYTDVESSNDRYLVSSVFQSNSGVNPKAYAVTSGYVCVHPHPTNTDLVTLVLKPNKQPSEFRNVSLPRIKYFIYRGVLRNTLLNSANTEVANSGNNIDLIDNIWNTHPDSVDYDNPAASTSILAVDTLGVTTLIKSSFQDNNAAQYQRSKAGESIGEFQASEFSFEVIFDLPGNEPTLEYLQTVDPIRNYVKANLVSGTISNYEEFVQRKSRAKILQYLDPAALYGAFYSDKVVIKDSSGNSVTANGGGNDYYNLLRKFYNKDVVYVDIRNEFNQSFNYFEFSTDDFFPNYSDNLKLELINDGGTNTLSSKNYYEGRWPILRLRNTPGGTLDFPAGNSESMNVLNISFSQGNNTNPLGLLINGFLFTGNMNRSWPEKKVSSNKRFINLVDDGSGNFEGINIAFPNHKPSGTTDLVPFYTQIKYIRQITETPASPTPSTETQFLDNLFEPSLYELPNNISQNELQITTYDSETYLDLKQNGNDIDLIVSTGIASDINNVTLFTISQDKRVGNSNRVNKVIPFVSDSNLGLIDFYTFFDGEYKRGSLVEDNVVRSGMSNPQIASFDGSTIYKLLHRFDDPSTDDFLGLTMTKLNFQNLLATIESEHTNSTINKNLGVWITMKNRNDRDNDLLTNIDELHLPKVSHINDNKKFLSFDLVLKGFTNTSGTLATVDISTGITAFANIENSSGAISNFFIDENASIGPVTRYAAPCKILWNQSDVDRPSRTTLTLTNFADPLTTVYKDDLKSFIEKLWASAVDNINEPSIIKHYPGFLLYLNVFSRLISKDSTTYTVGVGVNTVNGVTSFNVRKPESPTNVQLLFDPVSGALKPDIPFSHEGFLLEGANYLAMDHIAQNINTFLVTILRYRFRPARPYEDTYINDILPEIKNYPYIYNLMLLLKRNGIKFPDDHNSPLTFNGYQDYFEIFNSYTYFKELTLKLKSLYNNSNGINMACTEFTSLLDDYFNEIRNYVVEHTKCIYYALGGIGSNIHIYNYGTGNGSSTAALFDEAFGRSFFGYKVQPCSSTGTFPTGYSLPQPDNEFEIEVPVRHVPGKNNVVHMGLYGVNQMASISDTVSAYRGSSYVSGTPGSNDFEFVGVGETYTNFSPANWTNGVLSPNPIGNYLELTKDLVIVDNSIDKLTYKVKSLRGEEINRSIIFFQSDYNILNYHKSFQDPFGDDQYMLSSSQTNDLWDVSNPNEDANLSALIPFIKGATTIEIQMEGGFIGQEIIPIAYDVNSAPYLAGDKVTHDNKIYLANMNNSSQPGTSNEWIEVVFNPNQPYSQGDLIKHNDSIYSANTVISGSGVAFNISEWDLIVSDHDDSVTYSKGDVILFKSLRFKCISEIGTVGVFNQNHWVQLPFLSSDDCYQFDPINNWQPKGGCTEVSSASSPLVSEQFIRLRATFGTISYDSLSNKITINIESYASPLKSNLDDAITSYGLANSVPDLNSHTILGQDPNATNASVSGDSSYNQVLTALRCWGLMYGIINRIKERGNALNSGTDDLVLNDILDNMLNTNTSVSTTEAGTGSSSVVAKKINYNEFITKFKY